ncbi:putative tripeptidyl-peptidase II [Rosa chinensis]|uniref:Putative tripeptidyl-peptidase II n=1 Tax=Rosa chinensis TaxID=74649 RepID=A0A2P6RNJ0_ROSCH|nr:subtilisin-like protease SBT1.9 [Rosa chinensis]PRQ48006.1 putative tripeptidyl-peptidase II [Rosa chinensis]
MATLSLYVLALYVLPIMVSAESHSYIVHMDSSLKPKPFLDHHNWYLATLSSLSEGANGKMKLIHTYTEAMQGFSAILTLSELQALTSSLGFVSYSRNRPLKLLTTHSPQFLGLTPKSGAWPVSNYGEDVIIGVLDSGIWPESESFSDEGMTPVPSRWKGKCESGTQFNSSYCNNKLIGARFYSKGYRAENPDKKISMNSARDTNGHGTHTSAIAAGNYIKGASYFGYASGTATGMAPRARLAIYKVGWYEEVSPSDLLAGVDQAIRDGVDILSLSLGYSLFNDTYLGDDPVAVATFAAMKKGIFVAAAAGNYGPEYFTLSNGAPWALIVGAGTMDRKLGGILNLGNGMKISFISLYPGIFSRDTQIPLVLNNGCQSTKELRKLRGNIVVCIANSSIDFQVQNAKSAKVRAAVFITNTTVSDENDGSLFPAAFVADQDGKMLINYIKRSSHPKGALEFRKTFIGTKPAPKVDVYSSRGPFPSCPQILKPDILAPGTLILASWSTTSSVSLDPSHSMFSNFNLATGTSMSAPHVAGVAALIKSVHPDWSPAAIRSALMTTANPLDNTHSPIKDAYGNLIASPLAIGAGHINPNKALDPGLVYDAAADDYIKLLCAMNYTAKQIQTITGSIYRCANWSNTELNYPSFIAYFNSDGSNSAANIVQEFRRTLTNVGEEQSCYSVNFTAMPGFKLKVEPQRLTFKKKYEKRSYKLTLESPKFLKEVVVQGSLSWVDDGGKYKVRSPIVATNIVIDSLLKA